MAVTSDALFLQEQRRFRRLEVSLPVWITTREAFEAGQDVWELGTTRDISLGGSKVFVPPGEEEQWKEAARAGVEFVVKIEQKGEMGQAIPCYVRHAALDPETNRFALGVQFDESKAKEARSHAVKAGLSTIRTRRVWQGAFALAFVGVMLVTTVGMSTARNLRAEVTKLQQREKTAREELAKLSRPRLVSTKSQGIDAAFRRKEVTATLSELERNMQRLNDPKNMQVAIKEREAEAKQLGLSLTPGSTAARVQMAVAFPYGYNWPQVVTDLEAALARKVPQVVIFQDFAQGFPDLDAREARARGKSLQITWEPWHFSNPSAVKLGDIVSGKYDRYIDRFAASARSFGGEIWIRFGHEMNGNWYPWCITNNGQNPSVWKAAHKRVHDRFRAAGASNVRWIWCFNAEDVPVASWNDPFKTYPGNDYVDAVAIDGYNFGDTLAHSRWQSFEQLFAGPYERLVKAIPNKPIFIAETGCSSTGGDKVKWLADMDRSIRTRFPKVESVTWFEAAKEADWRMISSPSTAAQAKKIWGQPYYRRGVN